MTPKNIFTFLLIVISANFFVNFASCDPPASENQERKHASHNHDHNNNNLEVIAKWKVLDYKFKSETDRDDQIASEQFIPKNNYVSGIKLHGDRMFLTVPRLKPGVPLTLAYVHYHGKHLNSPKLIPYPSWQMQELRNCAAFQNVISMEIDQHDRMWIIDSGRINILTSNPLNLCPPSISILDLKTNQVIHKHTFAPEVSSPTAALLDDLVVACTSKKHCWVYISDTNDNKLTVYDMKEDRSWSVQHSSMFPDPSATNFEISGINYTLSFGINGIALSNKKADYDRVYYSPVSSYNLYSVSTKTLKHARSSGTSTLPDSNIRTEGTGVSQSDGMTMDSTGQLFYGQLNRNALAYVLVKKKTVSEENTYAQNDKLLEWIDALWFDKGHLYFTSNRLNRYIVDTLDPSVYNFRILRIHTGTKSYMYY